MPNLVGLMRCADTHFHLKNGHVSSFKIMGLLDISTMGKVMLSKFHTEINSGLSLPLDQILALLCETLIVRNIEQIIINQQILMYITVVYSYTR